MSVEDVAKGLVELVKLGEYDKAMEEYYDNDIVSVEPMGDPAIVTGLEAVKAKTEWWSKNFEFHGQEVIGPFVNGDQFTALYKVDVTFKQTGKRQWMEEIALYVVKDGKVVHETFFS